MDEFLVFLKRGGRSPGAITQISGYLGDFESFMEGLGKSAADADPDDLHDFVEDIESAPKSSAKKHLWALVYYFDYLNKPELKRLAGELRKGRIQRTPFLLKDFRGVDPVHVEKLAEVGIVNIDQMLAAGGTPAGRQELAEQSCVPLEKVLEFAKLSDLARIPGIKGIRARLYVDAGVDTIEKLARYEPEEFRQKIIRFVEQTGFDGIPTLPAEAQSAIRKALSLPKVLEL